MIRFMLFVSAAFCALVLGSAVNAANVDLSLNLEFNNPADMNSGGTWTAVAKADENGLAGIVFLVEGSNNDASIILQAANVFEVFETQQLGVVVEVVTGSDLVSPTYDVGVIGGTFVSTYVDPVGIEPLNGKIDLGSFTGGVGLASGTFNPGIIPDLIEMSGPLSQGANVFVGTAAVLASLDTTVRAPIPEPATIGLLGLGLIGVVAVRRRN